MMRISTKQFSFCFIGLWLFFLSVNCQKKRSENSEAETRLSNSGERSSSLPLPVAITNCDITITYVNSPKRVITIGQHTTEVLLALGLKDLIVGWAFPDNEPLPVVPLIAQQYPSKEVFFSKNPDFIYSGYLGTFSEERLGARESLKKLGINSFVPLSRCVENARPATIEDAYNDIITLGKIFNVEARAIHLADSLKQEISIIINKVEVVKQRVRVWIFSGGYADGTPIAMGGYDLSSNLVNLAGGQNIFEDVHKQGFETNLEEIIQRDPEIIILRESILDPNADRSIRFLTEDPSLSTIKAVKNKNFVIVPFTSFLPGVKNLLAVRIMTQKFYPEKF